MQGKIICVQGNIADFNIVISGSEINHGKFISKNTDDMDGQLFFRKNAFPVLEVFEKDKEEIIDAANVILKEGYGEIIKELKLNTIDVPYATVEKFLSDGGVRLMVTTQIMPNIVVNGYKGVVLENINGMTRREIIDCLIKKIIDINFIHVPEPLIEEAVEKETFKQIQNIKGEICNYADLFNMMQDEFENFKNEIRPTIIDKLKKELMLKGIANQENIKIKAEDFEKYFRDLAKHLNIPLEDENNISDDDLEKIKNAIRLYKVVEMIYNSAILIA